MGMIRVSDEAEKKIKEYAAKNNIANTKALDEMLGAAGGNEPYMRKMSDYDLVEALSGIDFPSESIPNPTAREMFVALDDSPLWVDKQVYTNLVDGGGIDSATFVLRKGFVCFRNYSYPTTDYKLMRIDPSVTSFLTEKGVL